MLGILKSLETQSIIFVQAVAQNIVAANRLTCVLHSHCGNKEGSIPMRNAKMSHTNIKG